MQEMRPVIFRWRQSFSAFAYLLLVLQQKLESGTSFVSPATVGRRFQQRSRGPLSDPLQYKTDPNGFGSSKLSNATASFARKGITNDSIVVGKEDNDVSSQSDTDTKMAEAGTLGDIMSRVDGAAAASSTLSDIVDRRDGLVTSSIRTGTLASRYGIEHPLDRMALTANGNLQRLVSSYYDAPVKVLVDYCRPIQDSNLHLKAKQWDRLVHLNVHNQTFCKAHSIITVYDPLCQKLVESGEVGLGQLFRYLDILPEFELQNAGPYPKETGGGFWREYTLKCTELSCSIHEDFRQGIWDLKPPQESS
jgi:hypothetical protein